MQFLEKQRRSDECDPLDRRQVCLLLWYGDSNYRMVTVVGFIDILQQYSLRWKLQNAVLSCIKDPKRITALPPPEYALRILNFAHSHLLHDSKTYGSFR